MKCFLISDNTDTQMGMRLAGVEGVVVSKRQDAMDALNDAASRSDIAVVFVTRRIVEFCGQEISAMKLTLRQPLIVEIPDSNGDSHISETLSGYVSDAVGIRI